MGPVKVLLPVSTVELSPWMLVVIPPLPDILPLSVSQRLAPDDGAIVRPPAPSTRLAEIPTFAPAGPET